MALQDLLNVPNDDAGWEIFVFSNSQAVREINEAILAQKSVNLFNWPLYPVNPNDLTGFLDRNQEAHTNFNGVLGLPGVNLEDSNLSNLSNREAWIYNNFREVFAAREALKI